MLLRKINKNRWMVLSLLVGLILSISLVCSVPIYSRGILQRVILKDMENYLSTKHEYPAVISIQKSLDRNEQADKEKIYSGINELIEGKVLRNIDLKLISSQIDLEATHLTIQQDDKEQGMKFAKIEAISEIQNHIKILNGKIFSGTRSNSGEYEAIVSEQAMQKLDLLLNKTYVIKDYANPSNEPFKVKIVGVYRYNDPNDPFWFGSDMQNSESLIIDFALFKNDFIMNKGWGILSSLIWNYSFDYGDIVKKNSQQFINQINLSEKILNDEYNEKVISQDKNTGQSNIDMITPLGELLNKSIEKGQYTKTVLWTLLVPIFSILLIYIFMVSNLIIEQEKNEIAVLKSRGASSFNILSIYLLESVLISSIAVVLGPPLGLLLCKIIGASNGFLEFVQRASLNVAVTPMEYLYAVIMAIFFIVTMMIPVLYASKTSIVIHKQSKFRNAKNPFWHRYFLDMVLMAIAIIGLRSYKMQRSIITEAGLKSTDLPIDPLLYLITTFFILSLGLLFLRGFPYIIKGIFWIGRKRWSTTAYVSLINVGRAGAKNQFFMLFLILTISIGIFNFKAARTINTSMEDTARYLTGADIVIKTESNTSIEKKVNQDPFSISKNLQGVKSATKVLKIDNVGFKSLYHQYNGISLMGIIPGEFGRVAWFEDGLLDKHWYSYLNQLTTQPNTVFLSAYFKNKHIVSIGDKLTLSWQGMGDNVEVFVRGFIDYWPSYDLKNTMLIVANLDYLNEMAHVSGNEIWLKKEPETSSKVIYMDLESKMFGFEKIDNAEQKIISIKNDPILQGTNGSLTLGFISTILITIIGFLMYWILSIMGRALQFGILRAIVFP
jgi:putative ABC transport system permease protein